VTMKGRQPIPMVDVARQFAMVGEKAGAAVMRVLESGRYILGNEVSAFEREMAAYLGVAEAVGVASGTDALFLALKALGVGPGDEVITTPFTFIATAEAAANLGAAPRFVDIDEATFNIDPGMIAGAVTKNTKAVIAVHLFGHPADIEECGRVCEEHGLYLVEDCAQSLGAEAAGRKAGSFGSASAFSFFPSKNLGAAGDAGMVCADDAEIVGRIRLLRAHGSSRKYYHEAVGVNSRLDALQAAFLRVKMEHLDEWNRERASIASYYDSHLKGVATPPVKPGCTHSYHQYTVRSDRRDEVRRSLEEAGIASAIYYPVPLHLQPCFEDLGYSEGDLPVSEKAAAEVLSLPIFPGMTGEEMERVCDAVNGT
jgi:dTDP-4-amino-4,6-dideoxygalactose transaminase